MSFVILIGVSAFLSAFLGCVQSINVNRRRYAWAALTSVGIALCQLFLYKLVPSVSHFSEGAAFVVCGLLGAQLSMFVAHKTK